MKKIKVLLYSAAFFVALSASFAFKPSVTQAPNSWIHSTTSICTTPVFCAGGPLPCVVNSKAAFTDKNTCNVSSFMQ